MSDKLFDVLMGLLELFTFLVSLGLFCWAVLESLFILAMAAVLLVLCSGINFFLHHNEFPLCSKD